MAAQQKQDLEQRLCATMQELSTANSPAERAAHCTGLGGIAYQLDGLEQRIRDQQAEMARAMANVLDVLEHLHPASQRRTVLEMRYIDGRTWSEISRRLFLSRSRCAQLEAEAIDHLLHNPEVRELLASAQQGQ